MYQSLVSQTGDEVLVWLGEVYFESLNDGTKVKLLADGTEMAQSQASDLMLCSRPNSSFNFLPRTF